MLAHIIGTPCTYLDGSSYHNPNISGCNTIQTYETTCPSRWLFFGRVLVEGSWINVSVESRGTGKESRYISLIKIVVCRGGGVIHAWRSIHTYIMIILDIWTRVQSMPLSIGLLVQYTPDVWMYSIYYIDLNKNQYHICLWCDGYIILNTLCSQLTMAIILYFYLCEMYHQLKGFYKLVLYRKNLYVLYLNL